MIRRALLASVSVLALAYPATAYTPTAVTVQHLPTNAALLAASTVSYPNGVVRDDFAVGVGASPLSFRPSNAPCSLNSGAGDNGSQVKSANGKCWLAVFPANIRDVLQFGADPTGTADATNAIANTCISANASGGALIFPAGTSYLINQGQTFSDGTNHNLCTFTNGKVSILGNGVTIIDDAVYGADNTNFFLFNLNGGAGHVVNGFRYTLNHPLSLPLSVPRGPFIIGSFSALTKHLTASNLSMFGGGGVADLGGGTMFTVENAYAQDSVYGIVTPNGGAGSSTFWVTCLHVERCGFTYGGSFGSYPQQQWHVVSQNGIANDFLIAGAPEGTGNIELWYTVPPRNIGTYASSYLTFDQKVANGIIANVRAHVHIDMLGDNSGLSGPAVVSGKYTTSVLNSVTDNIVVDGSIYNVPAGHTGTPVIDWNRALDAPWTSETQYGISFSDLFVTGAVPTTTMRVDMAPFSTTAEALSFGPNFHLTGARTFVNDNTLKRVDLANTSLNGNVLPYGCIGLAGSSTQTAPAVGSTAFYGVAGLTAGATSGGVLLPYPGTLRDLSIVADSLPASGSDTATLWNGSALQTCNISAGGSNGCTMGPWQFTSALSSFFIRYVTAANGTPRNIAWVARYCSP